MWGGKMFAKSMKATFRRNFITQIRAYPVSFFIGNVLRVFYTVLGAYFMYYVMFKKHMAASFVTYAGTNDYMNYIIVGSLSYTLLVRTMLNVSRSLITELREGTLESLMLAPFSRVGYFIGNMLQQTVMIMGELCVSILICIPFGINLADMNLIALLLGILVSLYCYFSLAMCLGAVMIYTRDTYISQNTLFLIIFLICGVVFPVEYLPQAIQGISYLLPVNESIMIVRQSALQGTGIAELMGDYISIFIKSTVYLVVGYKAIRKIEMIALEKIFG